MPPAFNLSQDQTLQFISFSLLLAQLANPARRNLLTRRCSSLSLVRTRTPEHPHKLSKQLVKDQVATFALPRRTILQHPDALSTPRLHQGALPGFLNRFSVPPKRSHPPSEPTILTSSDAVSTPAANALEHPRSQAFYSLRTGCQAPVASWQPAVPIRTRQTAGASHGPGTLSPGTPPRAGRRHAPGPPGSGVR